MKFIKVIDELTPADKDIHLIADYYATHKHAAVQRWLKKHPRFHMRFTPTSSSWLNMAERFFRDLTQNRLRRSVFRDVEELIVAIDGYVDKHNENPNLSSGPPKPPTSSKRSSGLAPNSIIVDPLAAPH